MNQPNRFRSSIHAQKYIGSRDTNCHEKTTSFSSANIKVCNFWLPLPPPKKNYPPWGIGVKSFFKTFFFLCAHGVCICFYKQDSQVLEQLKTSISRYTYFYIMCLCHSPIYFTLPRGGSSPLLVQLEEMIPTS